MMKNVKLWTEKEVLHNKNKLLSFLYSAKYNRKISISSGNIFVHLSFLSPYSKVGIMKIPLNF